MDANAGSGDSQRYPALDGLRGIAVLMVLANHFMPNLNYAPNRLVQWTSNLAQSGWAGVDLFFVLSGFLITGILLDHRKSGSYFTTFYARRALRIFPLYYGVLIVGLIMLWCGRISPAGNSQSVWSTQAWNWAYCTNIGMLIHPNGFHCDSVNFSHFWTLAIEEHFYIVWPLVVWLSPVSKLPAICLGTVIAVPVLRSLAVLADAPHLWFFQTPMRIDELALGGLVALMVRGKSPHHRWKTGLYVLGGLSLAVLTALFFQWRCLAARHWFMHSVGYSLLGLTFASVVAATASLPRGFYANKALEHGALTFFGKYSYGLYVIHGFLAPQIASWTPVEPMIHSIGTAFTGPVILALRIAVCVPIAMLSWHFFEAPILSLKKRFQYQPAC